MNIEDWLWCECEDCRDDRAIAFGRQRRARTISGRSLGRINARSAADEAPRQGEGTREHPEAPREARSWPKSRSDAARSNSALWAPRSIVLGRRQRRRLPARIVGRTAEVDVDAVEQAEISAAPAPARRRGT